MHLFIGSFFGLFRSIFWNIRHLVEMTATSKLLQRSIAARKVLK